MRSGISSPCARREGWFYCSSGNPRNWLDTRGQIRLYREFLLPRKPPGEWSSKYYTYESSKDMLSPIRQNLYDVLKLKASTEFSKGHRIAHSCVGPRSARRFSRPLVESNMASWDFREISSVQKRNPPSRGLRLRVRDGEALEANIRGGHATGGFLKHCSYQQEVLILLELITGSDLEQRAVACFTLARCIIAAGEPSG